MVVLIWNLTGKCDHLNESSWGTMLMSIKRYKVVLTLRPNFRVEKIHSWLGYFSVFKLMPGQINYSRASSLALGLDPPLWVASVDEWNAKKIRCQKYGHARSGWKGYHMAIFCCIFVLRHLWRTKRKRDSSSSNWTWHCNTWVCSTLYVVLE